MPKLFPETMIVAAGDRRACKALLRTGSRSFFAASHLLPREVREPATALYAFCRLADDAVDLDARRPRDRLDGLRDRLDRAYRGVPLDIPSDRAFAESVHRFAMPRALPEALLEGLAWDAEGRRYTNLSELLGYAARVAGSVGVMMAILMGVRDRAALARACDLGAAMQLTNIARDVGEDARAGRLYLPLDWLRETGIDLECWIGAPRFKPAIGAVVRRLLSEADRLYRLGESGIAALPIGARPGIMAARLLYAEIGREVARRGYDSMTSRAVVAPSRKIALCLRAARPRIGTCREMIDAPAQAEAQFLIDAVPPTPIRERTSLGEQVVWVFDLFARVEERRAMRGIEGGAS